MTQIHETEDDFTDFMCLAMTATGKKIDFNKD